MEKKTPSAGKVLRSDKFKRGGLATLMSVVFIAIIVVINILVGVLTDRFPSMNIDLTAQKLNTLSDQALDVAKNVEQKTTIYLIGEEDAYRKDRILANYGLPFSQVANLAERLREANSNISVEFIDPDTNPKFISDYAEENLTTGKVLVKTDKRYKVLAAGDLFSVQQSSTSATGYDSYSKVDSALAGALEMVNLDSVPVVAIATGHGEMLGSSNLSGFISAMEAQNFEVKEIDFLTEEIPEGTQVLMLPTPTADYTEDELKKIRAYLDDANNPVPASLLVTCHPTQGQLPNLAGFLEEWGLKVEEGMVAETDSSRMLLGSAAYMLVDQGEEILPDNQYSNLIAANSCPITRVFEGNGDVKTDAVWTTSDSAYVFTDGMDETAAENAKTDVQTVAAMATQFVQDSEKKTFRRSVLVFGSSYVFTDTFMNASAYGDKSFITDLMKYVTETDGSAVSVYTDQVQTNVRDVTASAATMNLLGLGVFTIGIPVAILVVGLVIFLRRRHL